MIPLREAREIGCASRGCPGTIRPSLHAKDRPTGWIRRGPDRRGWRISRRLPVGPAEVATDAFYECSACSRIYRLVVSFASCDFQPPRRRRAS